KAERGPGALECGEHFFEFMMRSERAAHEPRRARTGAELFNGPRGSHLERRMIGQTEIVVGGKIEQRRPVDLDAGALSGVHAAQFAKQPLFAQSRKALTQFTVESVFALGFSHR